MDSALPHCHDWVKAPFSILPVRRPGEGDKLHSDVGFGRLERNDFEFLVQGIGRGRERLAFDLELRFEIGQLLLQRRDILFGLPHVL